MKYLENPFDSMHTNLLSIRNYKLNYSKNLSIIDGAISDIYHDLERLDKLDACTGYKYAKRLKKLYGVRRELKEINEQMQAFEKNFNIEKTLDSMGRVMLKIDTEMPKQRNTRQKDILEDGSLTLKSGEKI